MICELDTVIPRPQLVTLSVEPDLRSESVASSAHGGKRYHPYALDLSAQLAEGRQLEEEMRKNFRVLGYEL